MQCRAPGAALTSTPEGRSSTSYIRAASTAPDMGPAQKICGAGRDPASAFVSFRVPALTTAPWGAGTHRSMHPTIGWAEAHTHPTLHRFIHRLSLNTTHNCMMGLNTMPRGGGGQALLTH